MRPQSIQDCKKEICNGETYGARRVGGGLRDTALLGGTVAIKVADQALGGGRGAAQVVRHLDDGDGVTLMIEFEVEWCRQAEALQMRL